MTFTSRWTRGGAALLAWRVGVGACAWGQTEFDRTPADIATTNLPRSSSPTGFPDVTWTRAFAREAGFTGFDGCASVPLSDGRVLWLFSDSIVGRVENGKHAPGATMVNNAVAITRGPDPDPEFFWGHGDKPRAMFPCVRAGEWYWLPGGAVDAGEQGPLVIFGARMGRTGKPDAGVWDFEGRGSDAIVIENPRDGPGAWRWHAHELFGADGGKAGRRRAWGAATLRDGAASYVFGIDSTDVFHKTLLVARCPTKLIACRDSWEFRGADGAWSAKPEDASAVCDNMADEFTITRVAGGYAMVHMEANLGRRVMVRRSEAIDGPWSEGQAVYTAPEPSGDSRIMVYGAKAHPEIGGDGLLVSYCVNSTDFWHMLGDATIYRARFVRVRGEEMEGRRDK